ncbi:hypothetical protein [Ancylobacter sp. SL191]|jgi:hypothetical protein|uniref:hypothetical protein n=1 Tax=Ancylobacter sp. SL191 TaxID=2995166 RepID=UPI00226F0A17|nr:hypothetical protein [Ancylobacter sp. SL191]WAC26897.1 hypothetical protein OU996_18095 [Ancylobacter sp. SL191]
MEQIIARPNHRFLVWLLILLPTTFGIGSLALWFWHRSFVYKVDPSGIYLWSGRFVPWKDVTGLLSRKSYSHVDHNVLRLDVLFDQGRGVVLPRWLENGEEVVQAVRAQVRQGLPAEARLKTHYVQRR